MNNSLKKIMIAFFSLVCFVFGIILSFSFNSPVFSFAVSQETIVPDIIPYGSTTTDVSIFIREPTYSVVYNNKIYFIDSGDKLLKIYDINEAEFDSNYVDLAGLNILDVCICNSSLYLLVNKTNYNTVVEIKLDNLTKYEFDSQIQLDAIYNILHVTNTSLKDNEGDAEDSKKYFLFTFSSSNYNVKSKVALLTEDFNMVSGFPIEIDFDDTSNSTNLIKTLNFVDSDGKTYLLFVYNTKIIYYSVNYLSSLSDLKDQKITNKSFTIPSSSGETQEGTGLSQNESIVEACITTFGEKSYLAISYKDIEDNSECLRLYSFNLNAGTDTQVRAFELEIECFNTRYALVNEDYVAFSSTQEQTLNYIKFNSSDSAITTTVSQPIENPSCEVTYISMENFEYKKVNTVTDIFENPWGASSGIPVGIGANVIKIGSAHLSNGTQIADYDYCMYTSSDGNKFGYIKNEYLDLLPQKTLSEAGYKTSRDSNGNVHAYASIWPNSSLYSLPTTFCSGKIGSSDLVAERIMQIENNSFVEILDVLGGYEANNMTMIKVKVNDNEVGFIEARCVRNPAETVDFVITNATIKNDNTKVYLSASSDATTLPFTLNSGKTVRINGKRDTKTGFTSITFNDEYGNEFTGYIETDYIKADSWSTLQIVGCILIAINLGLLILILIFKKNHLGSHGQKVGEDEIITK